MITWRHYGNGKTNYFLQLQGGKHEQTLYLGDINDSG